MDHALTLQHISLATAQSLTSRSERTLWRLIGDGSVLRVIENGKARIEINSIIPFACIPIDAADHEVILAADQGDPEAQSDLALLFLGASKPQEAIGWLQLAAKQDCPEAMHWLGRCHVEGNGVPKDEKAGLRWLMKAAACGHDISIRQMEAIRVLQPSANTAFQ